MLIENANYLPSFIAYSFLSVADPDREMAHFNNVDNSFAVILNLFCSVIW